MIYLDPALEIVWTPRHIEKWRLETETKGGEVAMLVKRFETLDDPFRRIESELTGLLGRTGLVASDREGRLTPPVEILGADSELVIRAELPGVDPDSVDVTLDDSTLRVRAERRIPTTEQGEYLRREFAYGTFECGVVLPTGIDPDKVSARYDAGILEIRVPRAADKAVKVPVQVGTSEKKGLKAAS
jgi:HSP20 family protein